MKKNSFAKCIMRPVAKDGTPTAKSAESDPLTEAQAAMILGVSVHTLRNWRWSRRPPAFQKIGKAVRYQMAELTAFLNSCTVSPRQVISALGATSNSNKVEEL